jgi:Spx/MgsR family transcriptional regulator|tara:strand:+ start:4408 stop:4755 length:348 start_codon:yes stop_codon:yes gene_type:complete
MPATVYGIKNCDTVKKARKWLEVNGSDYTFIDVREDGVDKAEVKRWLDLIGIDVVVNKRSTTWKQLSDEQKEGLSEQTALALLLANPTLIKRPVLTIDDSVLVGFKADQYHAIFN